MGWTRTTPDRTGLGYALLLSVPVGVGVSMGVLKAAGGGLWSPLVVGSGIVTALAIFSFVVASLVFEATDDG